MCHAKLWNFDRRKIPRMANSSAQSPAVLTNRTATFFHWVFAFLLTLAFGLEITSFFKPMPFVGPLDAAFIVVAAASILAGMWRQLPLQNVTLAALIIALIGGALSALGERTGLPFGPFLFGSGMGEPVLGNLPWAMPLVWVVAILVSRGVARMMLRPWRKNKNYGFRLIGFTAFLVLLLDLAIEPYAFHVRHYWLWERTALPVTWQGAALINFLAWALAAVLILLFVTPALIVKKPRSKKGADFHPLCMWLGALVLFGIGSGTAGLWPAVIADAVIAVGTAVFAIRGAMW